MASIAKAIDTVIDDEELRSSLALNARARAMDFSEVEIPYDEVKK